MDLQLRRKVRLISAWCRRQIVWRAARSTAKKPTNVPRTSAETATMRHQRRTTTQRRPLTTPTRTTIRCWRACSRSIRPRTSVLRLRQLPARAGTLQRSSALRQNLASTSTRWRVVKPTSVRGTAITLTLRVGTSFPSSSPPCPPRTDA